MAWAERPLLEPGNPGPPIAASKGFAVKVEDEVGTGANVKDPLHRRIGQYALSYLVGWAVRMPQDIDEAGQAEAWPVGGEG